MHHDPFNRSRLPADFSREGRVRLLGEFFHDVLAGREPSLESRMFVAGGACAWLQEGGDLERDFWRITSCRGSHETPSAVWTKLQTDPHPDEPTENADELNSGIDPLEQDPT